MFEERHTFLYFASCFNLIEFGSITYEGSICDTPEEFILFILIRPLNCIHYWKPRFVFDLFINFLARNNSTQKIFPMQSLPLSPN